MLIVQLEFLNKSARKNAGALFPFTTLLTGYDWGLNCTTIRITLNTKLNRLTYTYTAVVTDIDSGIWICAG